MPSEPRMGTDEENDADDSEDPVSDEPGAPDEPDEPDASDASDESGESVPRIVELEGEWIGAMPDAQTLAVADARRASDARHALPSASTRWIVLLQVGLVLAGASAWWSLLHLGVNASALEIAWFLSAAVGVILLVLGHLRRLTWQTLFGGVTSAGPLLFQMRGADVLLGYGLTTFNALLAALLAVSCVLAVLSVREIDAVA